MANELKTIQTAVGFMPQPYGLIFQVAFKVYDFATSWGRIDPLQAALGKLQAQIDAITNELQFVNDRLNDLNARVAKIENDAACQRLIDINREAKRILVALHLRPTDAFDRRILAVDAQVLADRFLNEPHIWEWTDVAVTQTIDNQGQPTSRTETALTPDFKVAIALPAYINALMTWILAIDLVTSGNGREVRQLFGAALMRHVEATGTRDDWVDDRQHPPVTIAEKVRARIGSEVFVDHKYADRDTGTCLFGVVAVNRMDHTRRDMGRVSFTMAGVHPGAAFPTLCTYSPTMTEPYEVMAEDEYATGTLAELRDALKDVYYKGGLRPEHVGEFVMSPAPVPSYLLGVHLDGEVDWFFQDAADAPLWRGPVRTRNGWGDYLEIIPAGGARFYGLAPNGDLHWFGHDLHAWDTGAPNWQGPKTVGTGWDGFTRIVAGGEGVVYAVRLDGKLLWYRHLGVKNGGDVQTWRGPLEQLDGFDKFAAVFSCGDGAIYGVAGNGDLVWHKHKKYTTGENEWEAPKVVGTSWQNFRDLFGQWEGMIYAQRADGRLLRYRHKGWKSGAKDWDEPVLVGFGSGTYKQVVADMPSELIVR